MSDEALKMIFDLESKGVDATTYQSLETGVMIAAAHGMRDVVKSYIARKANLDKQDWNGNTASIKAACNGFYDICKDLADARANLDIQGNQDERETATMAAIQHGFEDIALMYIDAGANMSLRSKGGMDTLFDAARHRCERVVERLVDMKIKDGTLVESSDALSGAIVWNENAREIKKIVTMLVAGGIDVGDNHSRREIWGNTYAFRCAQDRAKRGMEGWGEIAEILEKARLDQGYDINVPEFPAYDPQGISDYENKTKLAQAASLERKRQQQERDDRLIDSLYNSVKRTDKPPSP